MVDFGEKVAEWAVNLIASHPSAIGWWLFAFFIATLINFGIKTAWTYTEMPRWARFVLGVTMPVALNFYWLGKRFGIQQPPDLSASIRAADKQP